jgi:PAS domain-containing protein
LVVAVTGVALATALIFLVPLLKERGAFLIYLAVVALVTWFAGRTAGVFAIVLSGLAGAWFLLRPVDSLVIANSADVVRLFVFLIVSIIIGALQTSRNRAQVAAAQTERRLAFALQCANMGAWYSDLDTGHLSWSSNMADLLRLPPGEFTGTYDGFIQRIYRDDQEHVRHVMAEAIKAGGDFSVEHRVQWPEGSIRRFVTRGRILTDEYGRSAQIIGVTSDVSGLPWARGVGELPMTA